MGRLGWVFPPQITDLEPPSRTCPETRLHGDSRACQAVNQYEPLNLSSLRLYTNFSMFGRDPRSVALLIQAVGSSRSPASVSPQTVTFETGWEGDRSKEPMGWI